RVSFQRIVYPRNPSTWLRAARNSSVNVRRRSRPRWPSCLRWAACTGSSSRVSSFRPSGVIRAITVRRSLSSRRREIRPRFSRRSSSLVTSGSRVIIRLAISPQASPSGAPRRIRRTLYCVAERSSVLSTWIRPRDSMSVVRSRSTNPASSGQAARGRLFSGWLASFMRVHNARYNDYCQDALRVEYHHDEGVNITTTLSDNEEGGRRPDQQLFLFSVEQWCQFVCDRRLRPP